MKLHLGCGKRNFGKDWIHIDAAEFPHINSHDITNLPFEDETVDNIYCAHTLEYFSREEAVDVLIEWKRVLKGGGILRVAVPDFFAMAKLYVESRCTLDQITGPIYGRWEIQSEWGSRIIHHKTAYDFDCLVEVLEKAGFTDIGEYDWRETDHAEFDDHSQAYLPKMDKENGTLISLNIECKK